LRIFFRWDDILDADDDFSGKDWKISLRRFFKLTTQLGRILIWRAKKKITHDIKNER
jgi:hypothetical protein